MKKQFTQVQVWLIDRWVFVARCSSLDVLNRIKKRYTDNGVNARLA